MCLCIQDVLTIYKFYMEHFFDMAFTYPNRRKHALW
jgi:hypothetical protein